MRNSLVVCLIALALPAAAQDTSNTEQRLAACTAGIDVEKVSARADAYAASQNYDARLAELCAAGDKAGAAALQKEVQSGVEAQDPDAARMMACLADILGKDAVDPGDVCAP